MPKRRSKTEPGLANENTTVKRKGKFRARKAETPRQSRSYEPRSDSDSEGHNSGKENDNRTQNVRPRSERLRTKRVLGEQNPAKREALETIRQHRQKEKAGRKPQDEILAEEMKDPTIDLIISQAAQISLKDPDEGLSFKQQAKQYIQTFYPGRFTNTSIVPDVFEFGASNDRGSTAEEFVFNRLSKIEDEPMIVLHSHRFAEILEKITDGEWEGVNMSRNKHLVQGEMDFVCVHWDRGIVRLEVKSATSASRQAYDKAKQQLNNAREAFNKFFKRVKTLEKLSVYPASFVVMPNVSTKKAGPQKGCFAEHLASNEAFKAWLCKKCPPPKYIPKDIMEKNKLYDLFLSHLMPVVTAYPRSSRIQSDFNKLIQLTPKQFWLLSGCSDEQYVSGPAGSGKTEMIILKAIELPKEEKKLVICFNRGLKKYLETVRFPTGSNVEVRTLHELVYRLNSFFGWDLSEARLSARVDQALKDLTLRESEYLHHYPHIFVDEAQDMEGRWEELIKLLHKEGLNHLKWIFFDDNQKVKYANPPRVKQVYRLSFVIRNTRKIFAETQRHYTFGRDARVAHDVIGPDVKWVDELHPDDFEHPTNGRVSSLIRRSIKAVKEDLKIVKPGDITILMETEDLSDAYAEYLCYEEKIGESGLVKLDCYSINEMIKYMKDERWPLKFGGTGVTIDSIRRYKGLEAKVVIVLVPEKRERDMPYDELLYVAMSRCFCKLILLCTKNAKADLCASAM